MKFLRDMLSDPSLKSMDVDAQDRLAKHEKILQNKKMLRQVFVEFHHRFIQLAGRYFEASGLAIELGAGIAPIRSTYPEVRASDIVPAGHLDLVINAQEMDLPDNSVSALFGQNCFHHFPEPQLFFDEATRVLQKGGGIVLIEPYYGVVASYLFKRLFSSEGFDKSFPSWNTPAIGPMNGANQALSYLVFVRDKAIFEKDNPELELVHQEICTNYIRYLASGGLNFRQLVPDFAIPAVKFVEWVLSPLRPFTGLHHIIVIRKKN